MKVNDSVREKVKVVLRFRTAAAAAAADNGWMEAKKTL